MKIVLIYLAAMSAVLFVTMGVDKAKARNHKWRIPEGTLFLLAALGGALGGCLGMLAFRHKTRHALFCWGFPLLLVLQAAALILLRHFAIL